MANPYGISGGGAHVKVTTEELRAKAGDAETSIEKMKKSFEDLADSMAATSGYWEGEAGTLYRNTYRSQNDTIQEILKNIQEYPTKLLEIAGVYETSESTNIGTTSYLKADLL